MADQHKSRESRSTPETTSTRSTGGDTGRSSTMARRQSPRDYPAWRDPWLSPIRQWRNWTEQMDRFFNSFGLGASGSRLGDWDMWSPQVETFQRGNELVVRADLPGMAKDDVHVEVTDDSVIIQGERRHESVDDREGFYRSERNYGSFYREVPLPDGAIGDDAKASFKDGVLEITMPAPPHEATRGRRIDISEGTSSESRAGERGATSSDTSKNR